MSADEWMNKNDKIVYLITSLPVEFLPVEFFPVEFFPVEFLPIEFVVKWLDALLLLVDVDDDGLNKLLILLIDTADVLCSMASLEGDIFDGLSDISFRIFSKYLRNKKQKRMKKKKTIFIFDFQIFQFEFWLPFVFGTFF